MKHTKLSARLLAMLLALLMAFSVVPAQAYATEDTTPEPSVVEVSAVTLDQSTLSLKAGETANLSAAVSPDDATDKTVTWTTSDGAVATVADGTVTAVAAGEAIITAAAGEQAATCTVTVTAVPDPNPDPEPTEEGEEKTPAPTVAVTGISLSSVEESITVGTTGTLTATVTPENATDKTVIWASSDEAVVTVADGVITAVAEGNATITAKAGEFSASCTVTVAAEEVVDDTSELEDDNTLYADSPIAVKMTSSPYSAYIVYRADSKGNKTDSTEVTDSWKNYYSELPEGVTTFYFAASPNGHNAQIRYSINGGEYQTWGSRESPTITAPTKITFQIISEKEYKSGTEGWDGKAVNEFTVWVTTKSTESGGGEGGGDSDVNTNVLEAASDSELQEAVTKAGQTTGMTIKLTASFETVGNYAFGAGVNATLDGQGHTLTLTGNPLFSSLYGGSTVKNLKVTGSVSANSHVGAIAAALSGTISNCICDASVSAGHYYAGGLAGNLYSGAIVENSAALSETLNGGICGWGHASATIKNCWWTANVSAADAGNATPITNSEKVRSAYVAITNVNTATGYNWYTGEAPSDPADPITVHVTIANGSLVLTQAAVTVTDRNTDGKLDIDEALYAAHEDNCSGGYASVEGQYGLSITKLWGNDCGSYGYYVNNASAWSLADEVKEGDYLDAFIYTDLTAWSDSYCYFNKRIVTAKQGDALELTLTAAGYDASYNPITVPVAGATITINGEATDAVTDENGKATVILNTSGTCIISAISDSQILVPPVCVVNVAAATVPEGAPKLTDITFANNLSFAEDEIFAGEKCFYNVDFKYTGSNSYGKITATFDTDNYTAEFTYNEEVTQLTSGSSAWVMDIPYGITTLTLTVKEKTSELSTDYTFRITRLRSTDDTLDVSYGGIYIQSHNNQKLIPANEDGTPAGEAAGNVSNEIKYYYAKLAEDATQKFKLGADTNSFLAHKRYSIDNGATWTDFDGYNTREIQAPATVIIQILSDAAYYEGTEGWAATKTPNQFTVWVDGIAPDDTDIAVEFPGSGTQDDPYRLETAEHLKNLDDLVTADEAFSGKYFKITADIELGEGWDGIGKTIVTTITGSYNGASYELPKAQEFHPFAGILDGGGHTLTFHSCKPLFDCVRTATIQNLKIQGTITDDGLIANYIEDGTYTTASISGVTILSGTTIAGSGLLGGYASGSNWVTISNCHIQSDVTIGTAGASNIGGIAGDFNGTISGSTCAATVYGEDFVGGIVAGQGQSMSATLISGCSFSGSVIASGNYVGGISGCGYTGTAWGFSNNAGCIDIKGCTVTGSVTGGNYVGGILGAEPGVVQCWDNGVGEISNNKFTGKELKATSGSYVGGIIGYMKSLNRYNVISGNEYSAASKGIGVVTYVDTNYENPTHADGTTYVDTSKAIPAISGFGQNKSNHNRTDDPLGADAYKLAKPFGAEVEPYITKLEVSGNYKKEYEVGEELDLTGIVIKAVWNTGKKEELKIGTTEDTVKVTGYDKTKIGSQKLTLTYKSVSTQIEIVVKAKGEITVYFTLLGDRYHGEIDDPHTLRYGGLTTWIGRTECIVDANSTVWDVFRKVLNDNGYSYSGSGTYISAINGLAALDNGPHSGWMYTVNGGYPSVGMVDQILKDGDSIIFHYTDDYNVEYGKDKDDSKTAKAVIEKIKAIGIVTFTPECKQKIDEARAAYNALTYIEKKKVTNYSVLLAAEKKYEELKKADDLEKAKEVDALIAKIVTPITEKSKASILTARSAYDALTADQKAMVKNLKILIDAEADFALLTATEEDKAKAKEVSDLITKLGKITLESEEQIKKARAAYDRLTDLQKKLVRNYDVLVAAEKELERLKELDKHEDAYLTTGDTLEKLELTAGSEWVVLGLIRSGKEVDESYLDSARAYIRENVDENNRLHRSKSTENARMILALTAMGVDATNVDGIDLVAGLNEMEYLKKQGINGPIWALIALDCGNYPDPVGGDVTRESLIDVILENQCKDGGWALAGDLPEPDLTGMALQALAPYYEANEDVRLAVDTALEVLSEMQNEDGSFSAGESATSESISQVIVALTALGIHPDMDERFIKDGNSALDALLAFYVEGGGFKHLLSGKVNDIATEQAYYALSAYDRFLKGETRLYDMTDVFGKTTAQPAPVALEPEEEAEPVIIETQEPVKAPAPAPAEAEEDTLGDHIAMWFFSGLEHVLSWFI